MKTKGNKPREGKNAKWGTYLIAGLIVAALCVGILLYIGWFDIRTHVDSPNGDNVMNNYQIETAQPDAPGVNDWENPGHSNLREVVVDHAAGTNTVPMPE